MALVLALSACSEEEGSRVPAPGTRPDEPEQEAYSVQLHVHGSFSEGLGSIDSHSHEAAQLGVDAIWWSDHDFRITGHDRVSRFGFEDRRAALDEGESWVALERHPAKYLVPIGVQEGAELSFVEEPVLQGERSMRLALRAGGAEFVSSGLALETDRQAHRTSLAAGVHVRLGVFPEQLGAHARAFVRVDLSEHAPREGLALEPYALRYYLSNEGESAERVGAVYHIPMPFQAGEWNELELDLAADAARGFAFVPRRDDVLYRLTFGVSSRRRAQAVALFDDLRIEVDRSGPGLFETQREVLDEVGAHHPGVTQLQGVEISFASRHLNEFSVGTELLDYAAIARETPPSAEDPARIDESAFRRSILKLAVERAHARGGLISYNHMFGTAMEGAQAGRGREEQLANMLRSRAFGADLLEVGYRDRGGADLADHLWVWDRMALAGLRLIGLGVSDSHGGPAERWSGRSNDFVSWVFADSTAQPDMLEGLRAGRVFFGDIEYFDGRLDLRAARGWHMGHEVLTDVESVELEVRIDGARAGDRLRILENGELAAELDVRGGETVWKHGMTLSVETDTACRVELLGAAGEERAFSNPLHFLRGRVEAGLDPARGRFDVGGVRSVGVTNLRLLDARLRDGALWIELSAASGAGRLELELDRASGDLAVRPTVRLEGLSGSYGSSGSRVVFSDLGGAGHIVLTMDSSGAAR